jgi:2-C-methyl-D-erythritol 4-phosphate cytidylyltransferase
MKQTDKNIIMITAGGVGARFGSSVPKQYIEMGGRKVISYVIDACRQSRLADAVLVVAHPNYHDELAEEYGVDLAESGAELNVTKRNGLDYIRAHSSCEKLVVVDAVRPAIESRVIDRFFALLDQYDAVACAHKITDSLGRYGEWVVNREEYYTLSAPEGFRFNLIDKHFKAESPLTESIQQLPDTSKVYLDFDVPYYDKLTYPEDLAKIQAILGRTAVSQGK